jgi:hypothetical protein
MAMMMIGAAQCAHAADLPDLTDIPVLRGAFRDGLSSQSTLWQGAYIGAQYGISSTNFGVTLPALNSALSSMAAQTSPFGNTAITTTGTYNKTSSTGIGGFVGYNAQWQDVVLGVDGNYNMGGQFASAIVNPVTTTTVNGANTYTTTTTGSASIKVTDYGSARLRAGWSVGSFLPYATVGVAIGRGDVTRSVTVSGSSTPGPVAYGPLTDAQNKTGAFLYGYSYGGGLDVSLFGGLFARAEVDVTRFTTLWGMDATVAAARGGVGYKF